MFNNIIEKCRAPKLRNNILIQKFVGHKYGPIMFVFPSFACLCSINCPTALPPLTKPLCEPMAQQSGMIQSYHFCSPQRLRFGDSRVDPGHSTGVRNGWPQWFFLQRVSTAGSNKKSRAFCPRVWGGLHNGCPPWVSTTHIPRSRMKGAQKTHPLSSTLPPFVMKR